jgi:DNA-binding Xre family transcriptional regulator
MVSYKPLFRLLVDREMSKAELMRAAKLAPNTMTKIRKNEEVSMTVLNRICAVLGVSYGDIVEYIHPEGTAESK